MDKISVIIPTLNEEKHIGRTLSSLKKQLLDGDEIIVVDSYSKDRTVEIAKRFGARVLFKPRCGIGPAKTYGASHAKNEIIAMLDADGSPAPDWLERIRYGFSRYDTDAICGFDLYDAENTVRRAVYVAFSWAVFKIGKINYMATRIPWMAVNNCAIKKRMFMRRGGLKNVVCEDLDMATRSIGIKMIYDSRMKVTLSDRRFRSEGFLRTVWLWIKSDIAILRKGSKMAATSYSVVRV